VVSQKSADVRFAVALHRPFPFEPIGLEDFALAIYRGGSLGMRAVAALGILLAIHSEKIVGSFHIGTKMPCETTIGGFRDSAWITPEWRSMASNEVTGA
jgi:hypothetical protein